MRKVKIIFFIIVCLISLIIYIYYDNNRIIVKEILINDNSLPKEFNGFKILHITDLEGKFFGKNNVRIINALKDIKYDIVALGGDYVNKKNNSLKSILSLVDSLHKVPTYYTVGEKDFTDGRIWLPSGDLFKEFKRRNFVYVDCLVKISKGNKFIWITPLNVKHFKDKSKLESYINKTLDFNTRINDDFQKKFSKYDIDLSTRQAYAMWQMKDKDYKIVLTHKPFKGYDEYYENQQVALKENINDKDEFYTQYINYNLYLAGHTHGGQMRLPIIGPLAEPNRGFLPGDSYVKGLFEDKRNRKQFINAGLGASGPLFVRFRFMNPPEVVVIKLSTNQK